MLGKLSGWDDTIVALATPTGIGAIGVIRLSGSDAFRVVNELFPSKDLQAQPSHTLHVGFLKDGDQVLDEVVVALFKGPRSYTGEDVVEVSCHGSPYIQQQVIQSCVSRGARLAKPGEFTQRAFLHGKLDLVQAEAVADLIASNTEASRKAALHNIRGGFSAVLQQLRDRMLQFSALIELELDFAQEDVEFADRSQFFSLINEAERTVQHLLQSFQLGNVIKNGVQVAIIGKPNAGKSTLLNTLLNENRAIVSDIAGTTRDTIEETLNIDGILFRLVDTAGIRQHTSDVIESIGVEKSLEKMRQADVVIYLFDANETSVNELSEVAANMQEQSIQFLLAGNKADKSDETLLEEKFLGFEHITFISAKSEWNVDELKEKLVEMVLHGSVQTEGTVVTNARHQHALQQVASSLSDIHRGLDDKIPGDLLALDIRRCLHYLGEITGEISNEDRLDYIFSKFCIGK
ncbi:tRNA uridine-5-carboxymethylaminomethyl(34) synthesis GTPase MnmE [Pseudoflavitalea sp. G-6-1-2]|uniref:tRNA uridine-5-carboxymethylaminomethyl(34) synthesis GTPase MnmE n=1 Tax=Pseudoflavitalea sp. G-6-1-2 TaxID=2728841 RepID=UPI00146E2763|nr:tRNA uridine-5-carboxymethylaminomethyl(34) synthesis GTPase MnmE [Pseudoflavitalea sp. G-6-1-2]NML19271.1 tRNA uridine-5-carboxymethylaminomethyl(34) synthesis GTPase MnmE [Pseudoflavitalea sp. G-6-1-2]